MSFIPQLPGSVHKLVAGDDRKRHAAEKRRLRLKLSVLTILVFVAFVNGAAFVLMAAGTHELNAFNKNLTLLERSIGYRGLVHNFKNAVLRTDEPEYVDRALEAAADAQALAAELTVQAQNIGVEDAEPMLRPVRDMIQQYEFRIALVEEGASLGLSSEEIDEQVRFDNGPATIALDNFLSETQKVFVARERLYHVSALVLTILSVLLFSIVVLNQANRWEKLLAERSRLLYRNEALNRFAMSAAHDLRSPAAQVASVVELLGDKNDFVDPKSKQLLGLLGRISTSMMETISSVLEFSTKVESPIEKSLFDMRDLVQSAVSSIRRQYGTTHSVEVAELPDTPSDPLLMERVWENLIGNAIKYSKPGVAAEVRISGQRSGSSTIYVIEDKGKGIPESKATTIFEPLQRLDEGSDFESGYGVGLNFVKSIIERHGGSIHLDTNYTEGARFIISLPASS